MKQTKQNRGTTRIPLLGIEPADREIKCAPSKTATKITRSKWHPHRSIQKLRQR